MAPTAGWCRFENMFHCSPPHLSLASRWTLRSVGWDLKNRLSDIWKEWFRNSYDIILLLISSSSTYLFLFVWCYTLFHLIFMICIDNCWHSKIPGDKQLILQDIPWTCCSHPPWRKGSAALEPPGKAVGSGSASRRVKFRWFWSKFLLRFSGSWKKRLQMFGVWKFECQKVLLKKSQKESFENFGPLKNIWKTV